MEPSLLTLEQKVESIEKTVNEVKTALVGNDYSNKLGIIHTVAEHHQRLTALERQLERGKWMLVGLSAGSGIGIYEIIKNVIS